MKNGTVAVFVLLLAHFAQAQSVDCYADDSLQFKVEKTRVEIFMADDQGNISEQASFSKSDFDCQFDSARPEIFRCTSKINNRLEFVNSVLVQSSRLNPQTNLPEEVTNLEIRTNIKEIQNLGNEAERAKPFVFIDVDIVKEGEDSHKASVCYIGL